MWRMDKSEVYTSNKLESLYFFLHNIVKYLEVLTKKFVSYWLKGSNS